MERERIGYFLIILFFIIGVSGTIVRFTALNEGGVGQLGVTGGTKRTPCTGELTVTATSQEGGKCGFQADVNMKNCEGKRWYVFNGNSCGGILVCNGNINEPESNWRCSWQVDSGTHAFTLCADTDAKDSKTVSC